MNPTPARSLVVQVLADTDPVTLAQEINTFLAGLGQATVISIQLAESSTGYSALIVYSK
ncbi:MAG TPA: hypothetical protein VJ247_07785 [Gaiella sp.]|jgi:hypothetical protein|nr:hypothetical protein [Gaiella sp.]